MILPQLGRNPQQFDNVYNASVRAHDRGLGAVLADTAGSIASDMAANAVERKRKEEEQRKIFDAEFKQKQANAFVQKYGDAAMSGKTDLNSFYNELASLSPEVADRTLRIQSTLTAQNRPKSGPSDLDRLATQLRSDLMIKSDPVKWNNLTPEEQDSANQRITYAQQRLASNGSIYGDQTTQQQNDAPIVPRVFDEQKARDAVTAAIANDDPKTETVEGMVAARRAIAEIVRDSGIPNNDRSLQMVLSWLADIEKERGQIARELKAAEENNFNRDITKRRLAQDEKQIAESKQKNLEDDVAKYGSLQLAYNNLLKDPNDKTAKSSALTSVLRMESGAAIGDSEFLGRMKEWLSPADYQNLLNDMTGAGILVAGAISQNVAEANTKRIIDSYMDRVNTSKVIEFTRSKPPKRVLNVWDKEAPKPTTQQKQGAHGGRQETALERARRLKAERGGK